MVAKLKMTSTLTVAALAVTACSPKSPRPVLQSSSLPTTTLAPRFQNSIRDTVSSIHEQAEWGGKAVLITARNTSTSVQESAQWGVDATGHKGVFEARDTMTMTTSSAKELAQKFGHLIERAYHFIPLVMKEIARPRHPTRQQSLAIAAATSSSPPTLGVQTHPEGPTTQIEVTTVPNNDMRPGGVLTSFHTHLTAN